MSFDFDESSRESAQALVEPRPRRAGGFPDREEGEAGDANDAIERRSDSTAERDATAEGFWQIPDPGMPSDVMKPTTRSIPSEAALVAAPQQASASGHSWLATWLMQRNLWIRIRLAADAVVLAITAAVALAVGPDVDAAGKWLAVAFAVAVLAILHSRPAPDDRLQASALATFGNVLGLCSLVAMMTIALDAIVGGSHAVSLAFRLWVLSVGLLGLTRITLLVARRHGMRRHGLSTPTLIVGAGVVGAHIAHRLTSESYGLRPVGYLDADPMPRAPGSIAPTLPVLGSPDDLEEAVAQTGHGI